MDGELGGEADFLLQFAPQPAPEAFLQNILRNDNGGVGKVNRIRCIAPRDHTPLNARPFQKQRRSSKHIADQRERRVAEYDRRNAWAINLFYCNPKTRVAQKMCAATGRHATAANQDVSRAAALWIAGFQETL